MRKIARGTAALDALSGEDSLLDAKLEGIRLFEENYRLDAELTFRPRPRSRFSSIRLRMVKVVEYRLDFMSPYGFPDIERYKLLRLEDGRYYLCLDPYQEVEAREEEDSDFLIGADSILSATFKEDAPDSVTSETPSFHDGNLIGILLAEPDKVVLDLTDYAGNAYRMTLSGVLRLKAEPFLEGNIIREIRTCTGPGDHDAALAAVSGLSPEADRPKPYFVSSRSRLEKGELRLFHLVPSVGCGVSALCEAIQWTRLSGTGPASGSL